jgi:hypothetical protein
MPDPAAPRPNTGKHSKDPNFMAVVIASVVIVFLFLAGAWLFVRQEGGHLFHKTQPSHGPQSYLVQSAPSRFV